MNIECNSENNNQENLRNDQYRYYNSRDRREGIAKEIEKVMKDSSINWIERNKKIEQLRRAMESIS